MTSYPDNTALPLAKPISYHLPCLIKVGTSIPKSKVFRFENYWLKHSSFKEIFLAAWNIHVGFTDPAKKINAKFKNLRRALKLWAKSLSCLRKQIEELVECIYMWGFLEEYRDLTLFEKLQNFIERILIDSSQQSEDLLEAERQNQGC